MGRWVGRCGGVQAERTKSCWSLSSLCAVFQKATPRIRLGVIKSHAKLEEPLEYLHMLLGISKSMHKEIHP